MTSFFLLSSTTSSRSITACSPARRSCRSCHLENTKPNVRSLHSPTRSMMVNHDTPVKRLAPAANASTRMTVPPVNPKPCMTALPMISPSMPPGACGHDLDPSETPGDERAAEHDAPVCREAEEIQHQVGDVGADDAAGIMD